MKTHTKPFSISLDEKETRKILLFFQGVVLAKILSMVIKYAAFKLFQYYSLYAYSQKVFFGIDIFTTFILSTVLLCTIFLTIKKRQSLSKSTFLFLMTGLGLIALSQFTACANDILLGKYFLGTNHSVSNTIFNTIHINTFSSSVLFWVGALLILTYFIYKRTNKNKITEKNGWLYPEIILGLLMLTILILLFLSSVALFGISPLSAMAYTNSSLFFSFYMSQYQLIFQAFFSLVFFTTLFSMYTEKEAMELNDARLLKKLSLHCCYKVFQNHIPESFSDISTNKSAVQMNIIKK